MSGTQFLLPRGRGWLLVIGAKFFPGTSRGAPQEGPDGEQWAPRAGKASCHSSCGCLASPAQLQEGSLSWISARGVIIYVFKNVWILEPNYNKNIFKLISTSFWSCQLN